MAKLDLNAGIAAEAATNRNLIPAEPGWEALTAEAERVGRYIANLARSGIHLNPQRESIARKAARGVRPIAYWSFEARILYRALAAAAVAQQPPLDRTINAYLSFVKAPLVHARDLQNEMREPGQKRSLLMLFFLDAPFEYVVKSDLTSFYQFIDHAQLADELIAQGSDFRVVECLVDLLGEVQGAPRGLPQLLDGSDLLSEVYVDRVERRLLTQGYAAWRYNDDFRIACIDFAEALAAIEALDAASRELGLSVSEFKTRTYSFSRYSLETAGLDESPVGDAINPDDVEDVAGDYTDDFEASEEAAIQTIRSAKSREVGPDDIDLRTVTPDKVRLIRRAMAALVRAGNPAALDQVESLTAYIPYLTPTLVRYMRVVASDADQLTAVAEVVDRILKDVSLNYWQQHWFTSLVRETGLLDPEKLEVPEARLEWVRSRWNEQTVEPLRSEAFRALAAARRIPFSRVISEAESAPDAVKGVYLTAVHESAAEILTPAHERQLAALAGTNVIHRVLLRRS